MRYEARERWSLVIPYAAVLVFFIWFAFDYFMAVPWPPTLLALVPGAEGDPVGLTKRVCETAPHAGRCRGALPANDLSKLRCEKR